jgi:outer membrane protein with beta-barrel domain
MRPLSIRRSLAEATIAVAASIVPTPALRAQSSTSLGIAAGATVPLSAYATDKNTGYHLGLALDIRLPLPLLSTRIDGAFSELKYKGSSTKEQIWMANANIVVRAPGALSVTPYAIGGAGVYNRHRTLIFGNTSSTQFGVNGGAGLRFGSSTRGYTFLEVRYHIASGRNDIRMVPITFGVSF